MTKAAKPAPQPVNAKSVAQKSVASKTATAKQPAAQKAAPRKAAAPSSVSPHKVAKTQLVEMIAERTSLNKKQAGEVVACVLGSIVAALQAGKNVGLPGLGTLSITQTAARQGVRPGTNQRLTIPAGKKVRFKVATTLKGNI